MAHISFLGTFRIGSSSSARCPGIGSVGRECVAFLFQNPNHFFDRDDIIDRFWWHEERDGGKSALNLTASRLRRALKPMSSSKIELKADKWSLGVFQTRLGNSDTEELEEIYDKLQRKEGGVRDHYRRLSILYRGDFLPGHSGQWTLIERERLLSLFVRSGLLISDQLLSEGAYSEATDCCRTILIHDPLRESVHRRMMLLRALRGEGSAMRRHFFQFQDYVRVECSATPTGRTLKLYSALCQEPTQNELNAIIKHELMSS